MGYGQGGKRGEQESIRCLRERSLPLFILYRDFCYSPATSIISTISVCAAACSGRRAAHAEGAVKATRK